MDSVESSLIYELLILQIENFEIVRKIIRHNTLDKGTSKGKCFIGK